VRCEGLTGAAESNGCLGRVSGHEGPRARVLMDGGRSVGVNPRNLVVVFELLARLMCGGASYNNALQSVLKAPGFRASSQLRYDTPLLSFAFNFICRLCILELPDLFARDVLGRLDFTDLFARVGRPWLAAVLANNVPRAGRSAGMPFMVKGFLKSVELVSWAKDNGCPWTRQICALAARGGHLEVLQWARAHHCPWNENDMCQRAALGGNLEAGAHTRPLLSSTCCVSVIQLSKHRPQNVLASSRKVDACSPKKTLTLS